MSQPIGSQDALQLSLALAALLLRGVCVMFSYAPIVLLLAYYRRLIELRDKHLISPYFQQLSQPSQSNLVLLNPCIPPIILQPLSPSRHTWQDKITSLTMLRYCRNGNSIPTTRHLLCPTGT